MFQRDVLMLPECSYKLKGGLCGNGLTKDTRSWTQMSRIQLPHGACTVNFQLMQGWSSTGNTTSLIFAELRNRTAVQDRLSLEVSTQSQRLRRAQGDNVKRQMSSGDESNYTCLSKHLLYSQHQSASCIVPMETIAVS